VSNYYDTLDEDVPADDEYDADGESIFSEDEIEALLLIDAAFGEDVAEDVAEKVAAAGLRGRILQGISNAREALADRTYRKASGIARLGELLTGSRVRRMRRFTGQSKSLFSAARGSGPDNREARRVLATRLAVGGGAAALAGGGAAFAHKKQASGDIESLALDLLEFSGYDVR
jgi:hypothetical protein